MAHQIIYTSCRRGIRGAYDGLQIFSYDAGMPEDCLADTRQLFPSPDPQFVDCPALGYLPIEGGRALFTYNTKLLYDYMGPEGRGGNVLRQTVLGDAGELRCYPIEIAGAPYLRSSMGDEVRSSEAPDFLPAVSLDAPGTLDFPVVGAWLHEPVDGDEDKRMDALPVLLAGLLDCRDAGKRIAIVDSPHNVDCWIAALSFALPHDVMAQLSFLDSCDAPALSDAMILGIDPEDFEDIAGSFDFAAAGIEVYDMREDVSELPQHDQGDYEEFVGIVYGFYERTGSTLTDFVAFVERDCTPDLNHAQLERTYHLYRTLEDGLEETDDDDLLDALTFVESNNARGSEERLTRLFLDSTEALGARDAETYLAMLNYLLQRYGSMGDADRKKVCDLAITNIVSALTDPSDKLADRRLDAVVNSCASKGIDVYPLLLQDQYRNRIFGRPGAIPEARFRRFTDAVFTFAVRAYPRADDLRLDAPMGQLYSAILDYAYQTNRSLGGAIASKLQASRSADLPSLEQVTLLAADACKRAGGTDAALCKHFVALVKKEHPDRGVEAGTWLAGIGHHAQLEELFAGLAPSLDTNQVMELYFGLIKELYQDSEFARNVFDDMTEVCAKRLLDEWHKSCTPGMVGPATGTVTPGFLMSVVQPGPDQGTRDRKRLLEYVEKAARQHNFMPELFNSVIGSIAFYEIPNRLEEVRRLLVGAEEYEKATGVVMHGALWSAYASLVALDSSATPEVCLEKLTELSPSINLLGLSQTAFSAYLDAALIPIIRICRSIADMETVMGSLHLGKSQVNPSGPRVEALVSRMFDSATGNGRGKVRRGAQAHMGTLEMVAAYDVAYGLNYALSQQVQPFANKLKDEQKQMFLRGVRSHLSRPGWKGNRPIDDPVVASNMDELERQANEDHGLGSRITGFFRKK